MSQGRTSLPVNEDGGIDREAVRAMFMASKHLNWTQFAEDQGWDVLLTRRQLPVKQWIKEKRDVLAEKHMDILTGLVHQKKFDWQYDILKMMDEYPPAIDAALNIAKAKMSQVADMFRDYQENFQGKPEKMYRKAKNGTTIRILHPFEKISMGNIGALLAGIKSITDAKLKSLMLDKWALKKLDVPVEIEEATDIDGGTKAGPIFTIEGKEVIDAEDLQKWFDRYHDKPALGPVEEDQPSNEVQKIEPEPDGGS